MNIKMCFFFFICLIQLSIILLVTLHMDNQVFTLNSIYALNNNLVLPATPMSPMSVI